MKKATFRIPYLGLSGALLFTGATAASAQTSGTLSTQTATNWTTAPWAITSGTGTYPDGGGVATFNAPVNNVLGTVAAGTALTLNVPITLSGLTYNSPLTYQIAGTATNNLTLAATGATLNAVLTPANTPTLFQLPNAIIAPVAGGGTSGLTKIGGGTVAIGSTTAASSFVNTYTGGTHINGGILAINAVAATGDGVLGATGAGNGLSFNGGSLFVNVTGGLTTSRDILLEAGGGTIFTNTATTLNGVISGAGSFTPQGFAAVATTLTNANTYTGATITSGSAVSSLVLSGNGSIAPSASYDLAGTLTLNNSGTTGIDRLGDTAGITSHGALITITGNATTASAETVGAITLANGVTSLNVTAGTAGSTITTAGVTRQNGSTLFVRGTGLGGTPGAGVANVFATTAPTLIGGGGAAGTTTQSIVPWALGNTTASTTLTAAATVGSGLVTYSAATGFRPLATAEYATTLGTNATDNVRLATATAAPSGATANAVLFAPAAAATLSGGPINITSGAFVYSPTADVIGTVSAGLNFGSAEGVIQSTSALGVSGAITGSGGLTLASPSGATVTLSGANTYTGTTTLLSGITQYSGTLANDGVTAGAFGLSTTPITYNVGTQTTRLWATAASVINRDISVIGTGPGTADLGTSGTTYTVTVNGNINMARNLSLDGGTTATGAIIVNGTISGAGILSDLSSSYNVLNGTNTYTGGTNIQTGTYVAGNDAAFGTGTVFFSGAGTLLGSAARTLANNLFLSATPTIAGTAPLTFTGGTNLNGSRTLTVSNTALTTFSGTVANGSLTKGGVGAVAFNSATGNTFTGGFVNTGLAATSSAIYVNNTSGSGLGSGTVSIGAASATVYSTLAGNFTISGATTIAGRLSPGNGTGLTAALAGIGSIGSDNFGNNLTLSSATTSSLYLEIASSTSRDQITVAGTFTLAGTAFLATTGGYVVQAGDTFDFIDATTFAGTATVNTAGVTFAPGVTFDTSAFATSGVVTAVPEPTTFAFLGLGAVAVAGYAVRRRRALAV